ncbi:MAG: hypothetical protein A2Y10_18615 [Planctomycetes bacterium GWF2_41_51]|nr:MAG: hypothetical protein A2Y10_18615 [Planctomycetes bacterium GWF2_41_51]
MLHFFFIISFFTFSCFGVNAIKGFVFEDKNKNNKKDKNEKGLTDILVSNGIQVVQTDEKGRYELPVKDGGVIFVIKPAGWITRADELNIPRFYYIHKPQGSPDSVDFALNKNKESHSFDVVIFGDPQIKDEKELGYFYHDAVEGVVGIDAAFGVILGDIVFDNLGLYEDVSRAVSLIGINFYNLPGNHDMNYDAEGDEQSLETYKNFYGPTYYSFNYGDVHFIVLDNIIAKRIDDQWLRYEEGLTDRQLEFVKNDLSFVSKDKLIIVMGHATLKQFKKNKNEILDLLSQFPNTLSIAGHVHETENVFLKSDDGWQGKDFHHIYISGAVCGAWWQGFPGEDGIPHAMMSNGVPNGYSVISFNRNKYSIKFKAFGKDENYQMMAYMPDEITPEGASRTEVILNVFAGSEKSTAEIKVDSGNWQKMERKSDNSPHYLAAVKEEEKYGFPRYDWSKEPRETEHIWKAYLPDNLSEGTHILYFCTTDMYGQEYFSNRIFRIKAGKE